MTDQQLSGKWVGAYSYGEEYDEPMRGKTVAFEMEITVVNGVLKGTCTDEESMDYFEKPATITGAVLNDTIRFVKRYPHYWQNEKEGPRFIPKLPSQKIKYAGRFVQDRFEGGWEMITSLIDANGEPVSYKGFGRWFMNRKYEVGGRK